MRLLLRPVGALGLYPPLAVLVHDLQTPRVAADLAVLNDGSAHVWLDIDLDRLAAVRTHHQKLGFHVSASVNGMVVSENF